MIERINSPRDLAALNKEQLDQLAAEIRAFLIEKVSKSGGHLGPNLGVVELTIALHRIFESPNDVILFDTGHQSYVHKILTGRAKDFDKLRQRGGLSGYPSRSESSHDIIENSHASTALSWGDGISKGFELTGQNDRAVIVVVGDGALTGGMSWEALNNIAADKHRNLVIVVNDNARSYSPTIGGLASHLATLRLTQGYEKFLDFGKSIIKATPVVGDPLYSAIHGMKKGIKDFIAPQGMFEDLGLKYFGPIDGHNIEELEAALKKAKAFHGPVIIHAITEKGRGYEPALADEAERFHAVGIVNPETGMPVKNGGTSWTKVFGNELVEIGKENPKIVAITAAMMGPTGLDKFQANFPDRTIDVGIAEQHAVTFAAGIACEGLKPVVAIYSTFLQRGYDQLIHDVTLQNLPIVFAIDRAGIVGADGATHAGAFDIAFLRCLPNLVLMTPSNEQECRSMLTTAFMHDGPAAVRYPRGAGIGSETTGQALEPLALGKGRIVRSISEKQVPLKKIAFVCFGPLLYNALPVAEDLNATLVDMRFVKPLDEELLINIARTHDVLVFVEDSAVRGGAGSACLELLTEQNIQVQSIQIGLPDEYVEHGEVNFLLDLYGLSSEKIKQRVLARLH